MSLSTAHESTTSYRICISCAIRRAHWPCPEDGTGDDRVRCLECFRAERAQKQRDDVPVEPPAILRSPFDATLTEQQLSHRRRMLAFALMQGTHAASR
jgi:hypothetical protein